MPGPLSCRLDCQPPILGAWSACPANTIFRETVRSPSQSPSLEMFILAFLQLLRSLRKVHSKLWTVPAPTILVREGPVWNYVETNMAAGSGAALDLNGGTEKI